LVIAYVLPGFLSLWGLRYLSPDVERWLSPGSDSFINLDVVLFVTLASVAAGLIVSAVRWLLVDTLHSATGLRRPQWDDALLQSRLQAFEAVVQAHYRHYQFHSNAAVALAFDFGVWWFHSPAGSRLWPSLAFIAIECILLATSRDNLQKYYARGSRILDPNTQTEWRTDMSNGHGPKPTTKGQGSSGEKKPAPPPAEKPKQ
jgi:hypothetical protein